MSLSPYDGSRGGLELAKVNTILTKYESWDAGEALIPMLQEVQHDFGYVPDGVAALISEKFGLPLSQVYGVSTFYADFKVIKNAEHRILLCEGTACYVCGAQTLAKAVKEKLGIDYTEVTPDKQWTLERGNFCFGACQLMPMAEIDHTMYGHVTPEKLGQLIDEVNAGGGHNDHH